ncbi:branched-chain amino acid ABC transporter permease [Variovorax sp. WS11]|uniref:branched-chain amino acid ABC transporter permease n=1 Tax=Variovorax sp. WS11 TaxID=1105204 RepID=UPI000D0DC2DD|nr:branched-chain amino acid ABC transporter permease [Variovorax sp. WS11]NDZ18898.1 branched-chain amino acid ABC transporter permease [Variovorax sp. WS11]PSL80064.1 branched-chain amino acid ABC transporter permease [Variovorax sp. WS11]
MSYFIELVVSGLAVGAIYGLVAMSFAVIFKATGIVNFAQGEIGMLTAYTTWSLATTLGTGAVFTVLVSVVVGAVIGLLCERLIMRPMLGEPVLSVVLVTVGLAVVLRSLVTMIWDASPHKFEVARADEILEIGGIGMRVSQVGVFVVLLLALAGFWFFLRRSRFGVAMRAVAADEKTARLMGVSTARVQAVAWASASALAGLAGAFFAVIYGLAPTVFELGLKAFPATVLGGFDSILGSGASGLFIGVLENLVGGYLPSTLKEISGFMLILVVLMVRPFGLFGEKRIERV